MHERKAKLNPPCSLIEVERISNSLPHPLPVLWRQVLQVANGFDVLTPWPFYIFEASNLPYQNGSNTAEADKFFMCELDAVMPIGHDYEGGFFGLDLKTVTAEGDCQVVYFSNGFEEFREAGVAQFLNMFLNDADYERFVVGMPLRRPSPLDNGGEGNVR